MLSQLVKHSNCNFNCNYSNCPFNHLPRLPIKNVFQMLLKSIKCPLTKCAISKLYWCIQAHSKCLLFFVLQLVSSFRPSLNLMSLSPRVTANWSTLQLQTGQSEAMFRKTAGCCKPSWIIRASAGLKGFTVARLAMALTSRTVLNY